MRASALRTPNPPVNVFVTSDGNLVDRGNPLADVHALGEAEFTPGIGFAAFTGSVGLRFVRFKRKRF